MDNIQYLDNKECLIKANPYKVVQYHNKRIVVVPNSGAWIIGGDNITSLLSLCENSVSKGYLQENNNVEDLDDILKILYFSGIITINGKCCTDDIMKQEKIKSIEVSPRLLVLKYTNHCNLRCLYCYAYKEDTFNESLSYEDLEKAAGLVNDAIDGHYTIVFHGGEPLLRFRAMKHDVPALLDKYPNIDFSIQTNATLVNDEVASFLKKYKISAGVSLDGTNEQSNCLRCFQGGIPSYEKTLAGLTCLIKHGCNVSASIVLTKNNKDSVMSTIQVLYDMGVRQFIVLDYFPGGRGKDKKDDLATTVAEQIKVRKEILLYINDHNASHTDEKDKIRERKTTQLIRKLVYWRSMYMCSESPCGAGRRMIAIGADGNLFPCDEFISDDKEFVIDHVSNVNNLLDTLKNSPAVKKCYGHRIENIAKCSKCIWRNICHFHCAGNSFYFKGSLNQPGETCEFFHEMIPLTMELLYEGRIDPNNIL